MALDLVTCSSSFLWVASVSDCNLEHSFCFNSNACRSSAVLDFNCVWTVGEGGGGGGREEEGEGEENNYQVNSKQLWLSLVLTFDPSSLIAFEPSYTI